MDFDDIIKDFTSIFIGIIISLFLSQECLLQPQVLSIK
jgi:hypothetical protein